MSCTRFGHVRREAVDAGLLAEDLQQAVRVEAGDLGGVEAAEALLQLERPGEGLLHRHLLVEHEADEERERLGRDQLVRLGVPGEVERVGHASILARPGTARAMTDPIQKTEDLVAEAERGQSERTPWLAIGGVQVIVAALVGLVVTIVVTVYSLS